MSEKIKKYMEKPSKKKEVIKEDTKPIIKNILDESISIKASDKEAIYRAVEMPGNRTIVLNSYADTFSEKDRTLVFSRKSGTMVLVSYHSGLTEITSFIVKMCDELGYNFDVSDKPDEDIISFQIYVNRG